MSDLFDIYNSVFYVVSVRYREKLDSANMVDFDNVARVVLASVSDRDKVFCIENPPYIDEIVEALQPSAGIPNGVSYWFESAQMKHYQELLEKKDIDIELSRLKSVGVENENDFLYLTKICNVRTLMIPEYIFIEEDEWPFNTEVERKLLETEAYRIDPELTRQTWRLARKIEKVQMRNHSSI